MKILLTADPELPVPPQLYGGIERIIDLLATALRDHAHTVGLVAHRDSTCLVDRRFAWPGLRSQHSVDAMQNTIALQSAINTFKPDLIHSFSRILYLLPVLRSSIPKIMSYQRYPSARTTRWATQLAKGSIAFTGCSNYICRTGRSSGGVWHRIYNGVELEKYTFQPRVAPDAPLVFLSRIERIKGAHRAIAAARQSDRRLIIAGNYSTVGEAGRYWREEIEPQLGKNQIEYVGAINDVQKNELLGSAAAMIVPIEWDEPFGIVFAEALACGTPIISCGRGALPEIVRPGVDGFLIDTIDQAVAAIDRVSGLDRSACRQRAEQCFSATVMVDQYEQLYRRLLDCPIQSIPVSS